MIEKYKFMAIEIQSMTIEQIATRLRQIQLQSERDLINRIDRNHNEVYNESFTIQQISWNILKTDIEEEYREWVKNNGN